MSIPQHVRSSDRFDLIAGKHQDFVFRSYKPSKKQLYKLFVMALMIIGGVTVLVENNAMIASLLCVVVGFLLMFIAQHIERYRKLLHSTEFLNALFSSALGGAYQFCIVVQKEGEIIYLNHSFQDMFPDFVNQPRRNLRTLFSFYPIGDEVERQILSRLTQAGNSTLPVSIKAGKERAAQALTLVIEPIARPAGFVMIRAKSA